MTDDQLLIRRDAARRAGDYQAAAECDAAIDRNHRARIDRGVVIVTRNFDNYGSGELSRKQYLRNSARIWRALDRMGIAAPVSAARMIS